jgi:hypothetical protein
MQEAAVRLDAAIQIGDAEQTEKWLGFITEHRLDAPRTYEDALLRMNDTDTAAKWLIERLEDKDLRSAVLLSILVLLYSSYFLDFRLHVRPRHQFLFSLP